MKVHPSRFGSAAAWRCARRIVDAHRDAAPVGLRAALYYGPAADLDDPFRVGERDATLLEVLSGAPVPDLFDRSRLGFAVAGFPESRYYSVPGVLRIIVTTWEEFRAAARQLHPEIVHCVSGRHDLLHAVDPPTRQAVTFELARALRRLTTAESRTGT